jgi:hypothetical protein
MLVQTSRQPNSSTVSSPNQPLKSKVVPRGFSIDPAATEATGESGADNTNDNDPKSTEPNDPKHCNSNNTTSPGDPVDDNETNKQTWLPNSKYKREQNKIRKQNINVIFNYSNFTLTNTMEKVLSRGLNFCILPLKLDVTQVLVDFKRFERSMIWKEFWYGRETKEKYEKPIFKTRKTNLPKNCKPPNGLKTYLGAVKSELMDPKNREKVNNNLPNEEIAALKQLVILQKERQITIKKCDKGAGTMILDFNEYIKHVLNI